MKISGTAAVPLSQERTYAMLQDPAVLARSMPGCQRLERIAEGEYAMLMKMALASISGNFDGKVKITDTHPPDRFRMLVEGQGRIGFMKGEGLITLAAAGDHTTVSYDGDVQVGGLIANVGQRLVETTAKMMIKRFFDSFAAQAAAPSASA